MYATVLAQKEDRGDGESAAQRRADTVRGGSSSQERILLLAEDEFLTYSRAVADSVYSRRWKQKDWSVGSSPTLQD